MSTAPVFVVGVPRSGTTLLRRLLNAHPSLHLTFEASYFTLVRSLPSRVTASAFRDAWVGSLPFAWQRVPTHERSIAAPVGPPPRDPRWMTALMAYCARRQGKTRWGDKSPFHLYELGPILHAFPDARVVHIVRDPVAVVRSQHTVPWAGINLLATAVSVRSALDAVEPFRDRICEVRLEDLLRDRAGELKRILAFCALDWSDRVLDPERYAPRDEPPVPWLATGPRERASLPARPAMLPVDAYRISRITGQQRERYGYAPLPPVGRSAWGHLTRAVTDVRELCRVFLALARLRRVVYRWPRPAALEVFDAVNALYPEAVLACSPAERTQLRSWLRSPDSLG